MLTGVFAATGLWFLVRCVRSVAGVPVPGITGRISCAACAVMSVAMIGMSWSWGMRIPTWLQVGVFVPATAWFATLAAHSGRDSHLRRPRTTRLSHIHNALMMAAVVWMIVTMPASMAMGNRASHAMASSLANLPLSISGLTLVSALLAAYFLLAALPWFYRAVDTASKKRVHMYDAIGHAAMSLGMGAMLLFMT